jgi:hypothetical protein
MDLTSLIAAVKAAGALRSDAEAITALRATLETLGELLEPTPAAELAAHLPLEVRPYLLEPPGSTRRSFSVQEFCSRVASRSYGAAHCGRTYLKGVLIALLGTPGGGILRANVSEEYRVLVDALRAAQAPQSPPECDVPATQRTPVLA